jgi:hypothetical protein
LISSFRLQVGGTQQGPIGIAESVLTEDGADVPASDNMVLRKLLVSANCQLNFLYLAAHISLPLFLLLLVISAYRDTSILGKHCWRLAIIVARKDMWPQTAQWKSGRNLALFVGCLGTMQSSARRLVSLAPRDYHSVTWVCPFMPLMSAFYLVPIVCKRNVSVIEDISTCA